MKRIRNYLTYIKCILCFILAWIIVHIFKRSLIKEDIWLFQEKHTEARDNAYHLYRYVKENHPDIKAYFSIKKDSPDERKLIEYGNIIHSDSLLHYEYWIATKYSIGSQPYGACPYPSHWNYRLKKYCRKDQKTIFLRHGISKDAIPVFNTKFDLFVCSAPRELEFIQEKYGYSPKNAQLLGLCRFDNLMASNNVSNQILIMPTFRKYLVANNNEKDASAKECAAFKQSLFYKEYSKLLSDKRLLEYLRNADVKMVFYLHYSLQSFTKIFKEFENETVIVADRRYHDVQDLLIKSSILVTDYSSVFFDFAYMGKPEVFFQFDENEYRAGHYKKGYFDYRIDGFGPVYKNVEDVVDYLIKILEENCTTDPIYLDRINQFFSIRDNHNCERTYNAIINL